MDGFLGHGAVPIGAVRQNPNHFSDSTAISMFDRTLMLAVAG
jgi:hypothetical protein